MRICGSEGGVAFGHGFAVRIRLEGVALGAEEAGDQLLLPEQIITTRDAPRERRDEEGRQRRGGEDCPPAAGRPVDVAAPKTHDGRHYEERADREDTDAQRSEPNGSFPDHTVDAKARTRWPVMFRPHDRLLIALNA